MDSNQALNEIAKVHRSIEYLLSKTSGYGEIDENIEYRDTPDERLLENQVHSILNNLENINFKIDYITKPVKEIGILQKNRATNYYELINSKGDVVYEYHAGNRIEALIMLDGIETWTISRVEYNEDYYIVGASEVELEGLHVRLR